MKSRHVVFLSILALCLLLAYLNAQRALSGADQAGLIAGCPVCVKRLQEVEWIASSTLLVYSLGLISGLNPCLIALVSFIVMITPKSENSFRTALSRVSAMVAGILYSQVLLGFLILSIPNVIGYISSLILPLAVTLMVLGGLHILEAAGELIANEGEFKGLLSRTPEAVKKLLQRIAARKNPYFDFAAGALFSLVKFPCTTPLSLLIIAATPLQPVKQLANVVSFNLGVVFPVFLTGALLSAGLIKVGQISTLRRGGRIVQRAVVGSALILAAALMMI